MLQLINETVKDNTEFKENACLVGLVSSSIWLQSAQIVESVILFVDYSK